MVSSWIDIVNHLLETYSTGDVIANTLCCKALRCNQVHSEYTSKGIFVEALPDSVRNRMRSYRGTNRTTTFSNLSRGGPFLMIFQKETRPKATANKNTRHDGRQQRYESHKNDLSINKVSNSQSFTYRTHTPSQPTREKYVHALTNSLVSGTQANQIPSRNTD